MAESWGTMPASPLPRHSGVRRNPRSLPNVRMPARRRKGKLYAGMCLDRHEWASATSGVARRPELPAVPEGWGYVDYGFRRKDDISCPSNRQVDSGVSADAQARHALQGEMAQAIRP